MTTKDQLIVLLGIVLSALVSMCLMISLVYGGYLFAKWLTGDSRVRRVDCSIAEFHPDYPPQIKEQCRLVRSGEKII